MMRCLINYYLMTSSQHNVVTEDGRQWRIHATVPQGMDHKYKKRYDKEE